MKNYINGAAFGLDSAWRGNLFYLAYTKFTNVDGQLFDNKGIFVCNIHSQIARDQILVGNDDGKGKERYLYISKIVDFLKSKEGNDFKDRIEPKLVDMQDNKICMKYNQNKDDPSMPQIWNEDFYCASLKDLGYINRFLYN